MALSPKDTIESPAGDYENRNINITWGTNHKNHKQYLGMMPNWQLLFKNSKLLFKILMHTHQKIVKRSTNSN